MCQSGWEGTLGENEYIYMYDRMPKKLWMAVHDIVSEVVFKTIPKKKKCKKAIWLSDEASQMKLKAMEKRKDISI